MRKAPPSKHPNMVAAIRILKELKNPNIVEIANEYGIPSETLRGTWRNELRRMTEREDLDRALSGNRGTDAPSQKLSGVVMAVPDIHCPFEHPDALEFLKAIRAKFKPETIVFLGDEIDACAFSRYPRDPDGLAPGAEITKAREHLYEFYKTFPDVLVCESNHTIRPWKQAFQAGLPASFLPSYSTFLNAPDGWKWASHWEIGGVRYFHGDAGSSGFTAHIQYMRKFKQSCVIGHIHSYAGVNYEGKYFGMNAGCLIDTEAYCFKYAKHMAIPVSLGCGLVIGGKEAHFIPMHCDEAGRWTGRLHS